MKETELEEGEACFDQNDASIDPDRALSYIDKRLQNVLGHFQKDFEGGCTAEILGPIFGGYGSFLPTQKQSLAVHSNVKIPQRNSNFTKPETLRLEGVPLHSVTHPEPIPSKNETIANNSVNPTEQRSLKVRIKVSSDKSARKNTAIYNGLGLLSPSVSNGNNLEDSSGGPQPIVSHDITHCSPATILRDMTSFVVPGNRLLSPLNDSLLWLTRKGKILEKKPTFVDDSSSVFGEVKPMEGKEVSSRDKRKVPESMKFKNSKGDSKAPNLEKSMVKELVDNKHCSTNDLKVKVSSNSHCSTNDLKVKVSSNSLRPLNADVTTSDTHRAAKKDILNADVVTSDTNRAAKKDILNADVATSDTNRAAKKDIPVKKRETKEWMREQLFGSCFGIDEQKDVKTSSIEETKSQSSTRKLSLESRKTDKIKGKSTCSVVKNEPDASNKHKPDTFEKKAGLKAQVKVIERKNKLVKENLRLEPSGTMKDKKSAQKEIVKLRNSYKDILDTTVQEQSNQITDSETNCCELRKSVPITEVSAELAAVPLQIEVAPVAPPDNWVGCDRCEKWRLLPIGIEPENLPDKWLCSMSTWLPGRNHCDISEDETTKAVQEMNLHFISQKRESLNGVDSVNFRNPDQTNLNLNPETVPNKNKSVTEGSTASLRQTSHWSMDGQQHKQKRKSLSEENQSVLEKNVVNKSSDLNLSKSSNFAVGKHVDKVNGKNVNAGDVKLIKMKSKKVSDQHSNKIKTEATDVYRNNKPIKDLGENGFGSVPALPCMEEDNEHQCRDKLVISVKRQKESTQVSIKGKSSDGKSSENVEMHAKKRKLKDWQESQPCEDNVPDSKIGRKEKRLKTCNTADKSDNKSFLKGKTMKIILPSSKDNNSTNKSEEKKKKVTSTSRKDLESERFLLAATSSSSKVSDSCKRESLQERKGSPVESVSSSPMRALKISKKIHSKSGAIPRKLVASEDSITKIHKSAQDICEIDGGKIELKHKEASKIRNSSHNISDTVMDQSDGISTKDDANGAQKMKSKENDRKCGVQRVRVKVSDQSTDQKPYPNKFRKVELDAASNPEVSNKSVGDKVSRRFTSETVEHGGSEAKGDLGINVKREVKTICVDEPKTESVVKQRSSEERGLKQPGDGGNDGIMKDLGVLCFVKEYASSQTALTAFKRAEDSKDYADRIKISGFDYECKDAYFDSALKFLYAASLLEASSTDLSKSKGVDPVNVYSTAAKLCKTCAQVFEKEKELGSAALAYKCMEVAYMRIVYCKSLLTRQDLQTSLQMVTQGESPSSSASDVDNLNNQASMLSKSIAQSGTHVVARNQANFLRLLDITSDVSLAMDASRNTQNAYATLEEDGQNKEMMNSIKRAVDFSFQDVKEIVCLVQNAREAINRQGFRGGNKKKNRD